MKAIPLPWRPALFPRRSGWLPPRRAASHRSGRCWGPYAGHGSLLIPHRASRSWTTTIRRRPARGCPSQPAVPPGPRLPAQWPCPRQAQQATDASSFVRPVNIRRTSWTARRLRLHDIRLAARRARRTLGPFAQMPSDLQSPDLRRAVHAAVSTFEVIRWRYSAAGLSIATCPLAWSGLMTGPHGTRSRRRRCRERRPAHPGNRATGR